MKELFDNFTIKEIAKSVFEYVIEEVEDWTSLCYEDKIETKLVGEK